MQQYVSTEALGQLITKARCDRRWDMQQASEQTGLAPSTISSLETVKRPGGALQRTTVHKLINGYGLSEGQVARAACVEQPATARVPSGQVEQGTLVPWNGNGYTGGRYTGNGQDWLTTIVGAWPHLDTEDREALGKLAVRFTA